MNVILMVLRAYHQRKLSPEHSLWKGLLPSNALSLTGCLGGASLAQIWRIRERGGFCRRNRQWAGALWPGTGDATYLLLGLMNA